MALDHLQRQHLGFPIMTDKQKQYYFEMAKRGRMFHYKKDNRLVCFITYFLSNGEPTKYINREPWTIIDDEPEGDVLYIDQLLTDKNRDNPYLSYEIWREIKQFVREFYPNIKYIRHNRFKNGFAKPFKEGLYERIPLEVS